MAGEKDQLAQFLEQNPMPDIGVMDAEGIEEIFDDAPELSDAEVRQQYQKLLGEEPEEGEDEDEEEEDADGKAKTRKKGAVSEDSETVRKAEEWDRFEERFARDPKGFIKALIETLPEDAQREFTGKRGKESQYEDEDEEADDDFEPITSIEKDYIRRFKPEVRRQMDEIRQLTSGHAAVILDLLADREILRAALEAHLSLSGLSLPDADREEIKKAILSGKESSYRKKVERAFNRRMQAAKEKPATPYGSTQGLNIRRGESMAEIMRKLEAAGA